MSGMSGIGRAKLGVGDYVLKGEKRGQRSGAAQKRAPLLRRDREASTSPDV